MTTVELHKELDAVFERGLEVPQPSLTWQRRLEALEAAHLERQRTAAIFDMRCEQAAQIGFRRMTSAELVETLMGEPHTDQKERSDLPRQNHEYFFHHYTGETLTGDKCNWGGSCTDFYRMEKQGLWYLPPFAKVEKWRVRWGKLDYLKRVIPYGVILRINELKPLRLFNVFSVLAPIEAWERDTDIDPVVVAAIWEIPPVESGQPGTAGQAAHFFLAQW